MDKIQRVLFLFINCLFIAKYTTHLGNWIEQIIFILSYCLFIIFLWWLISNKFERLKEINAKLYYIIISLLIVTGIFLLHYFINPLYLRVDRWSAIHNFIYNLFKGVYPYSAHTHLGGYGSPFPVWQAFHIPFYLLGDVSLGMLFTFIFTAVSLKWLMGTFKKALIYILFLALSPAFWYEVAVRSDLMYNLILCSLAIAFIYKYNYKIQTNSMILGILCGLFISTRFSVIIPFAVFLLPGFFKSDLKHKIIFVSITILVFVLTFLPLILWDLNSLIFFKYNPFILQTRQGSLFETILIASLGIYLSTQWNNNFRLYSSFISILLFILVFTTFLHRMISDHFVNGLFDSAYDITYFSMALPFIIFSLNQGNITPIKNSL